MDTLIFTYKTLVRPTIDYKATIVPVFPLHLTKEISLTTLHLPHLNFIQWQRMCIPKNTYLKKKKKRKFYFVTFRPYGPNPR